MSSALGDLRTASFDLYRAACEANEYQVAYHALCCALHAAEDLGDSATCEAVERQAEQCRQRVDAMPGHKLSSQSAAARGHESIFKQLALTAHSARLRMESDAVKGKLKGRRAGALGED